MRRLPAAARPHEGRLGCQVGKQRFHFNCVFFFFLFVTDSLRRLAGLGCGQGREHARAQPLLSAALHTYDV